MRYYEVGPRLHWWIDAVTFPLVHITVLPVTALFHSVRYWLPPYPRSSTLTWRQYVLINIWRVRAQWSHLNLVNYPDPLADEIMPNEQFAEVDVRKVNTPPVRDEVPRVSVLKVAQDSVKPCVITSFMLRAKGITTKDLLAPAGTGEHAVLYIVGGGYAHGHPLSTHVSCSLAKITNARIFCVNYRKSLDDASAFPASLLDTLAAWQYLLDLGFEPKNILINGESAGANAALALSRYLTDLQGAGYTKFGQAGGLVLHCPWADMSTSFPSRSTNVYIVNSFQVKKADIKDHLIDLDVVYTPSHTRHFTDLTNPYLSPALAPAGDTHFAALAATNVPVYILAGTAEAFYDEICALAKGMREAGIDVTLRELDGGAHSDFVFIDRDPEWAGWSWPIVKADFESFWARFVGDHMPVLASAK